MDEYNFKITYHLLFENGAERRATIVVRASTEERAIAWLRDQVTLEGVKHLWIVECRLTREPR